MKLNRQPLALAIAFTITPFALPTFASATSPEHNHAPIESGTVLDKVHISALPFDEDANLTGASFGFLEDGLLFQRSAATLGDTLNNLPGVHSDTFGGGSSRPVIRGQTAPRVAVLSDGATVFDASAVSPDHAVTVEPLLMRKVEVLRGPSTLLYGGGAIGGVVNVLDNKIPTQRPRNGAEGFVALRGNTVADERAVAGDFTGELTPNLVFNAQGFKRDAEDYDVSGFTVPSIDGTYAESHGGSFGLSWVGEQGYLGVAYSYRRDEYGLPGHSHEFEDCTADGSLLRCGGGHQHDHGDDHEDPFVDLMSRRLDVRGEQLNPFDGIERIQFRSSYTDYKHHEIEDGQIGTTFLNKGYEHRIEAQHAPIAGWHGVVGIQYSDTQFNARGLEAFVPKVDSRILGVFVVEHYAFNDRWHLELGARNDYQKLAPVDDERGRPNRSGNAQSLSSALTWSFTPGYNVSASATRAQRMPQAQELYARGVHLATNTFECGLLDDQFTCGGAENDASVKTETSHNLGLNLRKIQGDLTFDAGLFVNAVDNFIYARTLDQIEEFRLIKYTQDDVLFYGAEIEARYQLTDNLAATVFGDSVRAEFRDSNENLPRIPANRLGTRLNAFWGDIDTELEYYRLSSQQRFADFETRTPGHHMLNASASYTLPTAQPSTVFIRGSNLLAEKVFNHTSFLADQVPEPGRNLTVGFRVDF